MLLSSMLVSSWFFCYKLKKDMRSLYISFFSDLEKSRVLLLFGGLPPQPHPNESEIGVGLYIMGHSWVKFSVIVHRFILNSN